MEDWKTKMESHVRAGIHLKDGMTWNGKQGGFQLYGVDAVVMWLNPSLRALLQPLFEELGEDFYSRLIAYEAAKTTYEDYHQMVTVMGQSFETAFRQWGDALSACGWGDFSIVQMDRENRRAIVQVDDPFEARILKTRDPQNCAPFICGKVSGMFSHAFNANCVAEIAGTEDRGGRLSLRIEVKTSTRSLEEDLLQLRENRSRTLNESLRAENNSLRRNHRRFLDVIETVGEFVWESDLGLRINYATNSASGILHLGDGKLTGQSWKFILPPDQRDRLEHMVESIGRDGRRFAEGEFLLRAPGRPDRWLLLRVKKLLDFSNNHIGYVGSARDISVERELRDQLHEQQKNAAYAAKMATLGEMAGGIAHEINTPLAMITLQADHLIEEAASGQLEAQEAQDAMELILMTTERISKIIQGLRTFARDAIQDPMVEVPLATLFEDTRVLCQNRMLGQGVDLTFEPIDPSIRIRCRPTQISQVLLNLLNNSCDAVAELPEKWIRVHVAVAGSKIHIHVEDSGPGIPEAVRQKLMQPFFTTKKVGQGTGLGLSISKGIVEAHSGQLALMPSRTNTCFVVALPRAA